jgi:hypothetical protein
VAGFGVSGVEPSGSASYLYGAEHYSRGHQMLGHLTVSHHFIEIEGSIPNSQDLFAIFMSRF